MADATQAISFDMIDSDEEKESTVHDENESWGRLISLNSKYSNIDLAGPQFIMGRQSMCDVKFEDRMISGLHCKIYREGGAKYLDQSADSQGNPLFQLTFLEDLSTNGTWVNGEKVGKGRSILLTNNAEISLTPQQSATTIKFVYQDHLSMKKKKKQDDDGISEKYDIRETLGTGNFAAVKLAIEKATGIKYAVKVIDKKKYMKNAANRKDSLMDEVEILKSVSHPNIIRINDVFDTEKTLYIVLELVTGGEMYDRIVEIGHFPEDVARKLFIQMLDAVHYLHQKGIVHRDLKPENILFSNKKYESLKISDFGLSRTISDGSFMQTMCGTPQYLAPEIITNNEHKGYGKCLQSFRLSGQPPFDENRRLDQAKAFEVTFSAPQWNSISEAAKDLIKCLLKFDPSQRYNTEQTLKHPWITGEDFSILAEQRRKEAEDARMQKEMEEQKQREEEERKKREEEERIEKLALEKAQQIKEEELRKLKEEEARIEEMKRKLEEDEKEMKKRKRDELTSQLPTDMDIDSDSPKSAKKMAIEDVRPLCHYGLQCYRKNPQHFRDFRHPDGFTFPKAMSSTNLNASSI